MNEEDRDWLKASSNFMLPPVKSRQVIPKVVRQCKYERNCERCKILRPGTYMVCHVRR